MSSLKCQSCGLVNFANAEKCKRCQKPLAAKSPQSWTPPDAAAYASNKTSTDLKTLLKILPFVIFGVPLVLALKDRMFGPEVKAGGYTDTFQLAVLVGCTIGLIGTAIVLFLMRKR